MSYSVYICNYRVSIKVAWVVLVVDEVSLQFVADSVRFPTGFLGCLKFLFFFHKSAGLSTSLIPVINAEEIEIAEESVHKPEIDKAATTFLKGFKAEFKKGKYLLSSSSHLRSIHLNQILMVLVSERTEYGLFRRWHHEAALDVVYSKDNDEFVDEFVD